MTRLRRIDPLGPLLAVLSMVVFLLHGFQGQLGRDLALYAYGGQRVADGVAPYVGVLNRAGPLAHLVPGTGALAAKVLGTDDVLTMRAEMAVISMVAVWVLYVVGRDLFGSRLTGVVAAASLLTFEGFVEFATNGPREKTPMLLFVTVGIWAVLHRRWGLAGVMVALGTLTWQPAFFLGGSVAAGALLVLPRRDLLRGMVRFAAGGVATVVVFVVGFWLWGALDDFIECFLLINARYTKQSDLVGYLTHQPEDLVNGYGWSLVILLLGLLATLVLAVVRVRGAGRSEAAHATQVGLGLATVVSIVWAALFAFNGWADAVVFLPSAALGFAGALHLLVRRIDARATVGVLTAVSVLALALAAYDAASTRSDVLPHQRQQVQRVLAAAPPGSTVASLGAPQALVFSHRVNPFRFQMFIGGFRDYFKATYPGGLRGIRQRVDSTHPTLIAVDHLEWYDFMQPLINQKYTKLGGAVRFTWYARNDIGPEAIKRLRHAVRANR